MREKNRMANNIINILFIIAYILFQISWIFEEVEIIGQIKSYITRAVVILLFFSILLKKYTKKELIVSFFVLVLTFIITYVSKSTVLLVNVMFILAFKNIDFKEFVKFDIILKLSLISILIVLYFCGFTSEGLIYRNSNEIRYSFGFQHPNLLGAYILAICTELVYLNYEKIKKRHYIFLIIILIIVNEVVDSRSAEIGLIFLGIFTFLSKIKKNNFIKARIIKDFFLYLPIIMTVISFVLAISYKYQSKFIIYIDQISSTRINCMYDFLNNYEIKLFGNYLENFGKFGKFLSTIDNTYIYILSQSGIICLGIYVIGLIRINIQSLKNHDYSIIIIIATYVIYGFVETYSCLVKTNIFLFLLALLIFYKDEKKLIIVGDENNKT